MSLRALLLTLFCAPLGCSSGGGLDGGIPDGGATSNDLANASPDSFNDGFASLIRERPYSLKVPSGYDAAHPTPLVILLHGYSASGATQEAYFQLAPLADEQTFLYAYPDGTKDRLGNRFWNATDACCDLYNTHIDDVAYIGAIIDDVESKYHVDPKRVFLVGHSNGAFMAHRLACDLAPRIAAIVALAGDNWKDASRCQPSEPVAVLQIHGDADAVIDYNGGSTNGTSDYPSAHDSVGSWVTKNGCSQTVDTSSPPLDLDSFLVGNETGVEKWPSCRAGSAAELWTIHGGSHLPALQTTFAATIYGFLTAHPKQ